MDTVVLLLALIVGLALGVAFGVLWARAGPGVGSGGQAAAERRAAEQLAVREGLDRLHDQLRDLERHDASWQGSLSQQVADVRLAADGLRQETHALSSALRRPQVRGRWGELHLRRVVELAGLVERCDFDVQVRVSDGGLRPDLVVHLAGGRRVVVDAKVPLDAFLDATGAADDDTRARHLLQHSRQVRHHVHALSAKSYWRALGHTPEFVVLFLPAEAVLAAALEADRTLIEDAAAHQVVLASPTTLIALLRTVAHGWAQEQVAEQAREIHELGRELHGRLARMTSHLDQVGRSLAAAVGHYNRAVGSLESRVLVSARRLGELGVGEPLPRVRQVQLAPRSVAEPGGPLRRAGPIPAEPTPTVEP